ncbi:MAG: prepilin-type N-terminal cleavage/methylation domain-containing protein [Aquificota bacterium]|nr:prepilin-type N-terminal cleavage/methylation domain-containing protein [Aquificota bacterium]
MRERGITLIEVLVVLGVLAVLMTLAFPAFNRWRLKASIEGDVRDMYAFIQKARTVAFTGKRDIRIEISGRNVCMTPAGQADPLECFPLRNPFTVNGSLVISRRGYFSGTGTIRYAGTADVSPAYDCLVVSVNRVRMGVWDGTECRPK